MSLTSLASYQRCCGRITDSWPAFLAKRDERLAQERRFGAASEKVAENILEDLFTIVLNWSIKDFNNQVAYADLVLTRLGVKHLIVEVKRPGALAWHERAVAAALEQAHRYADEQKVRSIAVSDGILLYACDHVPGGYRDRLFVRLDQPTPPLELWWLSVDGIYRVPESRGRLLPSGDVPVAPGADALLHPKYRLPASCFGYVGDASNPRTWHLPYLLVDGTPDLKRLPKAIQAILSNYRGAHVTTVPEAAIPEVLVTLGRTAHRLGKLPTTPASAGAYLRLQEALAQFDRLAEVLGTKNGC